MSQAVTHEIVPFVAGAYVDVSIPEPNAHFESIYHVQYRMVEPVGSGFIARTRVFANAFGFFTPEYVQEHLTPNGVSLIVATDYVGGGPDPPDPERVGGFVPSPKVPPFREGDVPGGGMSQ